jgi:hypothetical protein
MQLDIMILEGALRGPLITAFLNTASTTAAMTNRLKIQQAPKKVREFEEMFCKPT